MAGKEECSTKIVTMTAAPAFPDAGEATPADQTPRHLVFRGDDKRADASASAEAGGNGSTKHYLPDGFVRSILVLKREPLPDADYLEDLKHLYPPEWIEERRKEVEEAAELCRKVGDEFQEFRADVIEKLSTEGRVEVDEGYMARVEEFNEWTRQQWDRLGYRELLAPPADEKDMVTTTKRRGMRMKKKLSVPSLMYTVERGS